MGLDHLRIVDEWITLIVTALTSDRLFPWEVQIQDVKPNPASGPETIDRFLQIARGYESTVIPLQYTQPEITSPTSLVWSHHGS